MHNFMPRSETFKLQIVQSYAQTSYLAALLKLTKAR